MPSVNQRQILKKTATRTTVATSWFSTFDVAGNPGAGTLNAGNTSNGIVPVAGGAGYPALNSFNGGTGYLVGVNFGNTVAGRGRIYDRLWVGGAYAFNANQALSSQPSFASRVPSFHGLEIWVEMVTAATGNQAVNVTYRDTDNNSSSTGAVGIGSSPTVGRCWQLPLAAGDSGVQRIDNVVGSVASVGTFNVMVLRPLASGRIRVANDEVFINGTKKQFYETSALYALICPDGTSSGMPDYEFDITVVS